MDGTMMLEYVKVMYILFLLDVFLVAFWGVEHYKRDEGGFSCRFVNL